MTMINRGTNGRISERFAQAAYRQYKNARINRAEYESLIQTGHLPVDSKITQTDPTQDTYMTVTMPDGTTSRQLIVPGRNLQDPKDVNTSHRNLINDDGLKHVLRLTTAYNTPDYPTRGTDLMNSFIVALSVNEGRARQLGYDLSTINDVGLLFQRWTDLHVVRDAYNDEWMLNGRRSPDFTADYGRLDEALFNELIDDVVETGELEIPGTSNALGLGGQSPSLLNLKERDGSVYDKIRRDAPEFRPRQGETLEQNNERIEAELQAQGL
jgi:hypothetical protein